MAGWLDDHGLDDGWQLAPTLVAAGLDIAWLEHVAASRGRRGARGVGAVALLRG